MDHKDHILSVIEKEINILEDGFYYFFPGNGGGMSASDLRIIADYLDEKNAPVQQLLEREFTRDRWYGAADEDDEP